MSARLLRVLAGALLLGSYVHASGHAAPTARLTGVSTKTEGVGTTVVIETTAPVAYVTAQPDPLTLLIDLRNVSPGQVRPEKASGAVADVAIESSTDADGTEIARVRLLLARPVAAEVRSKWNTVIVELGGGAGQDAKASASADVSAAPGQNPPAAEKKPVPALVEPSRGSALTKVDATTGPDGTRVTFSGTGTWRPSSIETARDLPPRLVVDFPELRSTLPAVTPIGKGPIDRIRVAVNRRDPLVTRAVIDLKYPVAHRVESTDGAVVIVFDEKSPGALAGSVAPVRPVPESAAARAPAPDLRPSMASEKPEPVVVRTETAVPAQRARKPETATEPTPEPRPELKPEPKAELKPDVKPEPRFEVKPEPKAVESRSERQAPPAMEAKPQVQKRVPPPVAGEGEKQYTGHLVTFDFFQAELRSVLRTFSEISGLNVVIDPKIPPGTVDVSLREVPWDQALEVILRSHQLGYVLQNNVVRIAPLKVLEQEETERQRLVEAQAMGGQLKVFTKTLSYARAGDIAKLLKDTRVLTSRGSALVDERTNTLIINDLPEALVASEALIGVLDRSEPQVEIEAKIVQTSTDTARALGVQWGVGGRMSSGLANTAPIAFPAQSSVVGHTSGAREAVNGGAPGTAPTAVNLPAPAATSGFGISMGTLTGSFNLDVALTALERKGQGKILSQPKVMMQNNFEAEMTQGVQIPIQTVSNNTVTVTFKDAALTLKVKPQITASNTVMMNISLENASPDYSRQVNGIPPIDTQRAVTQVLVNDAETMVIGGIMNSRETSSKDGVPGLSRIPLLGWLFRRDITAEDLRELLIFITPRIRR
jgi:type IV pilus assembly protein PilQ